MDDQMHTGQFPQTRVVVLNMQVMAPLGSNDPFTGDTDISIGYLYYDLKTVTKATVTK